MNKEVLFCAPSDDQPVEGGVAWRCARCGFHSIDRHGHYPARIHRRCDIQRIGLGDYVSLAIAKLGITKQRVNRLLESWAKLRGKPPQEKQSGCGCTKREQALNRFGWAWERRLNAAGWWIWHRVVWLWNQPTKGLLGRCGRKNSPRRD